MRNKLCGSKLLYLATDAVVSVKLCSVDGRGEQDSRSRVSARCEVLTMISGRIADERYYKIFKKSLVDYL